MATLEELQKDTAVSGLIPNQIITVIGQEQDKGDSEESWLVFSKPVTTGEGILPGHVELAFSVMQDERTGRERVSAVTRSPLVVFFPTVLETHLGFLVQGPYRTTRTTPSRDNIPRHDSWNLHCVHKTADVLTGALRWLRDHDLLDTIVPQLGATKFPSLVVFSG